MKAGNHKSAGPPGGELPFWPGGKWLQDLLYFTEAYGSKKSSASSLLGQRLQELAIFGSKQLWLSCSFLKVFRAGRAGMREVCLTAF
jgi:hypothetical protein